MQVANAMAKRYGVEVYSTTIAKIEAGDRAVRVDELYAFADLFGMSADALLGRMSHGSDVVWAASKLSSTAHKCVGEVLNLQERLSSDVQDLTHYAERDHRRQSVESLIAAANVACMVLKEAQQELSAVACEFPLPGRS